MLDYCLHKVDKWTCVLFKQWRTHKNKRLPEIVLHKSIELKAWAICGVDIHHDERGQRRKRRDSLQVLAGTTDHKYANNFISITVTNNCTVRGTVLSRRSYSSISPRGVPHVRQSDRGEGKWLLLYKHLSTAQVWCCWRNTMQKVSLKHLYATAASSERLSVLHDLSTACQAKVALLRDLHEDWQWLQFTLENLQCPQSSTKLKEATSGWRHVFGCLGLVITVHHSASQCTLSDIRCSIQWCVLCC